MGILSIVMVVFLSTLTSIQKATVDQDVRSRTIDQVRLAMQSIDRQVRSGNLLYNPSTAYGSPALAAGYTLLIYTQANLPTTGDKCVLWSINSSNQLVTRQWPPLQPENATQWQIVAEDVVNRIGATPTTAFSLDPTGRTIMLTFLVNTDLPGSPQGDAAAEVFGDRPQHLVRLSGQRLRRPPDPNVMKESTMFERLRDDERGMAMVIALIVSFVLLTLGTVVVAQSIHDVESSGLDRRRLQSVNAAEAGNNYYYAYLQSTTVTTLNCQPVTQTIATAPATASFTATPTFYDATGSGDAVLQCHAVHQHLLPCVCRDHDDGFGHEPDVANDADLHPPHAGVRRLRPSDPVELSC